MFEYQYVILEYFGATLQLETFKQEGYKLQPVALVVVDESFTHDLQVC